MADEATFRPEAVPEDPPPEWSPDSSRNSGLPQGAFAGVLLDHKIAHPAAPARDRETHDDHRYSESLWESRRI